jgi:Zn-dependent peptidase ImmA (M78 family)
MFIAPIYKLQASLKKPTTRQQTDRNGGRKCQRFAKLKELQSHTQANAFAAHLILPNRTQAHPPPDQWTR